MYHQAALLVLALALLTLGCGTVAQVPPSAGAILEEFVDDFRKDPAATEPFTFAVRVTGNGGGDFHVVGSGRTAPEELADIELRAGMPEEPTMLYTLSLSTLRRIERGEVNALTAMAGARPDDAREMTFTAMPGYHPPSREFVDGLFPFTFHFWTRGLPEVVPFGEGLTREVHGADASVLYYQKGFRSAWMRLREGQHANRDRRDQVNPFPTMLIVTKGQATGRIGGREITGGAGQALFIPAGVTHEFWNANPEPVEAVLIMFGKGA